MLPRISRWSASLLAISSSLSEVTKNSIPWFAPLLLSVVCYHTSTVHCFSRWNRRRRARLLRLEVLGYQMVSVNFLKASSNRLGIGIIGLTGSTNPFSGCGCVEMWWSNGPAEEPVCSRQWDFRCAWIVVLLRYLPSNGGNWGHSKSVEEVSVSKVCASK